MGKFKESVKRLEVGSPKSEDGKYLIQLQIILSYLISSSILLVIHS